MRYDDGDDTEEIEGYEDDTDSDDTEELEGYE